LTPSPTVRSIITPVALQGGAEFDDPKSYQSEALVFLETVLPPKTDTQYIRYYALACIYTASFGVENKYTKIEFPVGQLQGWISSTGWMTNSSFCEWFGITCSKNAVEKIQLPNNRMFGIFAPEVQLLADSLLTIDLYNNPFLLADGNAGNEWIAKMLRLEQLFVGTTAFEYDGIPTYINKLRNLGK
jgi:hypothetical protein